MIGWLVVVIYSPTLQAAPPNVLTSPRGAVKLAGSSVSFSVSASGSAPLVYQWLFNDSEIAGATASVCTITNLKADNEGSYSVFVSNSEGETYSDYAELVVVIPPKITVQPEASPDPIYNGDSYTFSVEAEGTEPFSYQWRLNGSNLSGETDSTIIATTSGAYSVKVSNNVGGVGGSTISSNANLVVWFPPQITAQPVSRVAIEGKTTTFSVSVTGTKPLAYQWLFNDLEIPGATTNTYSATDLTSADAGNYSVHISNIADDIYSDYAELIVLVPPKIVEQPLSQTVDEGDDVTFTVAVQDDATWPLEYQWRYKGVNIEGANGEFLYLPQIDISQAGAYSVAISNEGGTIISTNANLTVRKAPFITGDPKDARVGLGTNVTFQVKAIGTAPLRYQWLFNDVAIPGATNSSYSFKPSKSTNAGLYSAFVSNVVDVVTSAPAALTVISETVLPTVTFTNPSLAFTTVTTPTMVVGGKASDNIGIVTVSYQLNNAPYQTANGTNLWSTPVLTFHPGTNILRAKSLDVSGNVSTVVTRSVFYSVKSTLTLVTNGPGTISGLANMNLEVNRGYTITAKPGAGQIFAGWTGTITNQSPVLNFLMQSNMVLQANFIPDHFLPRKGVYSGLFFETNGVTQNTSGAFTFNLYEKGGFSGKILMTGSSYSFTNRFFADGTCRFEVKRTGLTPLTVSLNLDVISNSDQVSGSVSNAARISQLLGDRCIFSQTNRAPYAGIYSLVIPGKSTSGLPTGDGYGIATVDALGNVRLTGSLSDGTAVSQGTKISKHGDWPLYVPILAGKGSIISWVTLQNSNNVAGDLSWIRPTVSTSKLYPNGFTNLTSIEGGVFQKPAKGVRVLNMTNGLVILSGGNLPGNLTSSFVLATNNSLVISSSNKLALKLNTTNGTVTGSFVHPTTKLTTPIKGVLVRQENQGHGYFLGTNQSGLFLLQPDQN